MPLTFLRVERVGTKRGKDNLCRVVEERIDLGDEGRVSKKDNPILMDLM